MKNASTRPWILQAICLLPLPALVAVFFLSSPFQAGVSEAFGLLRSGDLSGLESWARATGGWAPLILGGLMVLQALLRSLNMASWICQLSLEFRLFL